LHGRGDRLIPSPESLRLASILPSTASVSLHVTRLIGHAKAEKRIASSPLALLRDVARFAHVASRVLDRVAA